MPHVCIEGDKFGQFHPLLHGSIAASIIKKSVSPETQAAMRVLALFDLFSGDASPLNEYE